MTGSNIYLISSDIVSVMSVTFKDANTTGSFCHLLYVLSMMIISGYMCSRFPLYTITRYIDDMITNMCMFAIGFYLCAVLLAGHISLMICVYLDIMSIGIYLHYCLCLLISLHSPSYNIVGCGLCVTVWCFSDDLMSLIIIVIDLLLCLHV